MLFCGLIKGISLKICILCVRVIIFFIFFFNPFVLGSHHHHHQHTIVMLPSSFGDLGNGVCHVMKITMAESNPDLELLKIMLLQPQCSGWRQYDANNDHVSSL